MSIHSTSDYSIRKENGRKNRAWSNDGEINIVPHFVEFSTTSSHGVQLNVQLENSLSKESERFHKSISCIIRVSQVFGLFPMSGVSSSSPEILKFSLKSLRSLYSFIIFVMLSSLLFRSLIIVIKNIMETSSRASSIPVSFAAATINTGCGGATLFEFLIFFGLVPRWIELQKNWYNMETLINSFNHECPKLRWKFKVITLILMICAIGEHTWCIVQAITPQTRTNSSNELPNNHSASQALLFLDFVTELGDTFFLVIITFSCYIWNFTDLFIILVSTGLAERYKFLNKMTMDSVELSATYWHKLRKNYSALSKIVKETDKLISPLILLSCLHNLLFICLRLLIGIMPDGNFSFNTIYPFLSFGFVVMRMLAVMFSAARVNEHSKTILPALFDCPKFKYTIETERLQFQLASDEIALTGMNFFSITRNFILTIAGAVVSWEIILLQFSRAR